MKKLSLLIVILFTTLIITACNKSGYHYVEGKINIVTTTTHLGDLAKQLGGNNVSVVNLMTVGVDPHNYQPQPSDTTALLKADLIIVHGLHLEAKMVDVIEKLGDKVLTIGKYLDDSKLLKDEDGAIDPHIWFDVSLWKSVALIVANKLMEFDASHQSFYKSQLDAYTVELDDLNQYVINKVSELPIEKRVLVTAHNAFQYFASAYGFKVHAIQGISTETQASPSDIQALANLVVSLKVKAIFIESSVPQRTVQSVINAAKEQGHTLIIGGELYSDSLGNSDDGAETYILTIKKNVETIVAALK